MLLLIENCHLSQRVLISMISISPSSFIALRKVYISFVGLASIACLYSLLKPGISAPIHPSSQMLSAMNAVDNLKVLSTETTKLDNDSTDRMLSKLYQYNLSDGGNVKSVMVRVRKQGDFKIEGYGLLTKNVSPIYIKDSRFSDSIPYSIIGILAKHQTFQTCIVPRSTKIEEVDVRLSPLTSIVRSMRVSSSNRWLSKILGLEKSPDYSCLVLTYKPSSKFTNTASVRTWSAIVKEVQRALATNPL